MSDAAAATVIARAGGLDAFPAFYINQALRVWSLSQNNAKWRVNDEIDAWHAMYTPYAATIVLDGPTVQHLRDRKVLWASRIARELTEVPLILRRETGDG